MITKLEYFICIVEQKTYWQASLVLNISQSALSKQIMKLEEQLNVTLFDRSHRSVKLTKIGHVVYLDALKTVEQYHYMLENINNFNNNGNTINIASLPLIYQNNINKIFDKLNHKYQIKISEGIEHKIFSTTNQQVYPFIITRKVNINDYHTLKLTDDYLVLLLNKKHHLSNNKSLDIAFLMNDIFHTLDKDTLIAQHISNLFINIKTEHHFRIESIIDSVLNNNNIGLVMASSIKHLKLDNIKVIEIGENTNNDIVLAYHHKKRLNEYQQAFISDLKKVLK